MAPWMIGANPDNDVPTKLLRRKVRYSGPLYCGFERTVAVRDASIVILGFQELNKVLKLIS